MESSPQQGSSGPPFSSSSIVLYPPGFVDILKEGRLERLAAEFRIEVMRYLQLPNLMALIRASPVFYSTYRYYRLEVLRSSTLVTLHDVLPDALLALAIDNKITHHRSNPLPLEHRGRPLHLSNFQLRERDRKRGQRASRRLVQAYLANRQVEPQALLDSLSDQQLQEIVTYYTRVVAPIRVNFCHFTLAHFFRVAIHVREDAIALNRLPSSEPPLTPREETWMLSAIYRFHIACRLQALRENAWIRQSALDWFDERVKLKIWEKEQVHCVEGFLLYSTTNVLSAWRKQAINNPAALLELDRAFGDQTLTNGFGQAGQSATVLRRLQVGSFVYNNGLNCHNHLLRWGDALPRSKQR